MENKFASLRSLSLQLASILFITILMTSNSFSGEVQYSHPKVDGYALDVCREWGQNCGKPSADAYCKSQGHNYAMGYTVIHNAPPTKIINGRQLCNTPYCARITWVKCQTERYKRTNPQVQQGVNWGNHRYLVVNQAMTWSQADKYARQNGGHLVTISNQAENEFVTNLARNSGVKRTYWIGFTDLGQEGYWRWTSQERVTYSNWHNGEPNNDENIEHCAEVGWHSKYSWNDSPCNDKKFFVIEWDR